MADGTGSAATTGVPAEKDVAFGCAVAHGGAVGVQGWFDASAIW